MNRGSDAEESQKSFEEKVKGGLDLEADCDEERFGSLGESAVRLNSHEPDAKVVPAIPELMILKKQGSSSSSEDPTVEDLSGGSELQSGQVGAERSGGTILDASCRVTKERPRGLTTSSDRGSVSRQPLRRAAEPGSTVCVCAGPVVQATREGPVWKWNGTEQMSPGVGGAQPREDQRRKVDGVVSGSAQEKVEENEDVWKLNAERGRPFRRHGSGGEETKETEGLHTEGCARRRKEEIGVP